MTPAFRIERHATLSDETRAALFGWGADVFGTAELDIEWRRSADLHLVGLEDDAPVSHCGLLAHTISIGGAPQRVGGIKGVITLPQARGRGHATRLMRTASEILATEWHVDFALLFCFARLEPFYRRLAWRRLDVPVKIEQRGGSIDAPMSTMILELADRRWPGGEVDVRSLPW